MNLTIILTKKKDFICSYLSMITQNKKEVKNYINRFIKFFKNTLTQINL